MELLEEKLEEPKCALAACLEDLVKLEGGSGQQAGPKWHVDVSCRLDRSDIASKAWPERR